MEQKSIEIKGKKYLIRELSFKEAQILGKIENTVETNDELVKLAVVEPKITTSDLTIKEGVDLIKAILEFNGLTKDFTDPQGTKPDIQKTTS